MQCKLVHSYIKVTIVVTNINNNLILLMCIPLSKFRPRMGIIIITGKWGGESMHNEVGFGKQDSTKTIVQLCMDGFDL